jgi:threonine dehydratase
MNHDDLIALSDIYKARRGSASLVGRTPLVEAPWLSQLTGAQVFFKLENLQVTGSFKIRGAANRLLNLPQPARERGVITVSSGNHGRAVSHVAGKLGIPVVVCLSDTVPANKREAIGELGAEVIVFGKTYDEAAEGAARLQEERGLTMIHPFDDPLVIAGQGTIGLELLEDFPEIDTLIAPLSGGGLLSGIALALKSTDPAIHVIGVSMERGPAMVESLRAGKVVDIVEEPTLADALVGGIGLENLYTFDLIQKHMDDAILVSEEEIAGAMAFALHKHHLVVEGGGAVGIAAMLYDKVERFGQNIAIVISGGNVDLPVLMNIARDYQTTWK